MQIKAGSKGLVSLFCSPGAPLEWRVTVDKKRLSKYTKGGGWLRLEGRVVANGLRDSFDFGVVEFREVLGAHHRPD